MNGQFDLGDLTPKKYFFSIAIVLGLLFAFIADDSEESLPLVFLQWQVQTVLPMAILIGTHMLLSTNHSFTKLGPGLALFISGVIAASLFSPVALLIDFQLEPLPSNRGFAVELLNEWVGVVPPVTICWLALNLPWLLGYRFQKVERQEDQSEGGDKRPDVVPGFMELLPPEKRGSLLFLKSELHYVQVVTDRGSGLILYNLGDAVSQLPSDSGMLVHRSYWVAFDAVVQLTRQAREGKLELKNGQTLPVSRSKLKAVRERFDALEC